MNSYLAIGAALSAVAALVHVGCLYFGAPWYRFFGAGETMARNAEAGRLQPAVITAVIVCVLSVWSIYALSGAGLIVKLPLQIPVLVVITGVYSLRGIAGLFFARTSAFGNTATFWLWSSIICVVIGAFHLVGLVQIWHTIGVT